MEIYFIRHTAVDVPAGYLYGQTDVGLKPSFEEEAGKVKSLLETLEFDQIYTSPLSRCVRLCEYCGYENAHPDNRIKELNFGDWEMKSLPELTGNPDVEKWFADWQNFRIPGGESFTDQYKRVSEFIKEITQSGPGRVAVFAHGGVITCARVYANEYPIEEAFSHLPDYGEVVKLTF
ncbi:MAG: alpha-ribazole phosphatase [Tannerellaceae bacterium]|nr:alpha-ribazole phosphatase [Tannerellaceae bacterium]